MAGQKRGGINNQLLIGVVPRAAGAWRVEGRCQGGATSPGRTVVNRYDVVLVSLLLAFAMPPRRGPITSARDSNSV